MYRLHHAAARGNVNHVETDSRVTCSYHGKNIEHLKI